MAKKSSIARNAHRAKLIEKYAEKRRELKAKILDPKTSDEEFFKSINISSISSDSNNGFRASVEIEVNSKNEEKKEAPEKEETKNNAPEL